MNEREKLKQQLINKLIANARAEIGYRASGKNHTKYATQYFNNHPNYQNALWCDTL